MTLPEAPERSAMPAVMADLAGLDFNPEWAVMYLPPYTVRRITVRLTDPGCWALLTVAEVMEGCLPETARVLPGPRDTPGPVLAAWAQSELGYPVTLVPATVTISARRRFARKHGEPVFLVRRNA